MSPGEVGRSLWRAVPGMQGVSASDILAGLTLWGVLVPEALAYAGMAGMPVQAGLYTLLFSLPVYFFLGGSPVLVCAATSSESIMMAAVVAPLAAGDPVRHVALTALLVFLTGAVFLLAGVLRLGRLTAFLSKPVMTGFVFGLAIYIAASQLHKLLGLPRGDGDIFLQIVHLAGHLDRANPVTALVGFGALGLLVLLERAAPRLPAGLGIMVLGIAASRFFDLGGAYGVDTVRAIPSGLPALAFPDLHRADVKALLPAAAGLALVAFSQALGAAENYAARFKSPVDADRELKALGTANLGSAFFGGILAGGSMSSTAVNVAAGAKSKLSSLLAAVLIGLTLFFLTPVFEGLPEAVLGAVVMHAVSRLMKVSEVRRYLRLSRHEFGLCLVALFGVVLLDILPGLVLAVTASLLLLVYFASQIDIAVMGEITDCDIIWVDARRHAKAREVPGIRVLRMEGTLFFANAARFRSAVLELARQIPGTRALVVQLKANRQLCVTSADMLAALAGELRQAGLVLAFVDLSPGVAAVMRKSGLAASVGEAHLYPAIASAVAGLQAELGLPGPAGLPVRRSLRPSPGAA